MGEEQANMGTDYVRPYIAHRVASDSASWTVGIAMWDTDGSFDKAAFDLDSPRIVNPPQNSDQAITFFNEMNNQNIVLRGFASDNTQRTERDTG